MDENECLRLLRTGRTKQVEHAWERQSADNLLRKACCEAVASGNNDRLSQWSQALDADQGVITKKFSADHNTAARAFLWCARAVVLEEADNRDGRLDHAISACSKPDLIEDRKAWAWDVICALRHSPSPDQYVFRPVVHDRCRAIPVAYAKSGKGSLQNELTDRGLLRLGQQIRRGGDMVVDSLWEER
jgi:hypothetical protein